MMAAHTTWRQLKQAQPESPAARHGYERARSAYTLGKKVREAREARGWSQAQLAARVGISQPAIARLELGSTEPRVSTLHRIAAALDARLVVDLVLDEPSATVGRDEA
jgi:ribosome-binding protein aMBF1 (putative translation factor)